MSDYTHTEDALEEDARRRAQGIAADDAAAHSAAADDQRPSPDAEAEQAQSTGRQHDIEAASCQRSQRDRRMRGPRR